MRLRLLNFLIRLDLWRQRNLPRLGRFLRQNIRLILCYALFWLTPLICFLMVELLSQNDPFKLADWQWAMNLAWYFCVLFVTWLITGRRRWSISLTTLFSFLAGLANHYVLAFRGRALFPIDVLSIRTAANVAGNYDYTPDKYVWGGLAILGAVILAVIFLPKQKKRAKARWLTITKIVVSLGWAAYIFAFFFTSMLPSLGIYAQQWKTQGNGFLLNFTVAASYMRPEKPEGYSTARAEALIDELEAGGFASDPVNAETAPVTNFIIVMDESFADLTEFDSLTLSGDPTPYYHALTENTIKGDMVSPVTGGGTAAVEFEALTGNSMYFFSYGTVAYQLYMTGKTPALSWTGDALGLETSAYHPYLSSGWNRTNAYRLMGFDSQYYQDLIIDGTAFDTEYEDSEIVRQFVSDSADFDRIYRTTEQANSAGKGSFIFNVTMQNHSGYALSWKHLSRSVSLTGDFADQDYDNSTSQYLALATATDRAIEELIEHYSQIEEPTVILFFGDHQPPLSNQLYKDIYGKSLDDRTQEEILQQYVTPFFLWANFDIEEQEGVVIGSNYLGVLASQLAGYPQTGYMKFLSAMSEHFSALSSTNIVMEDGRILGGSETETLSEEEQTWIERYHWLQYYNLFGPDGREEFFFWGDNE